jgi:ADP-glucose pyrophosphorylase
MEPHHDFSICERERSLQIELTTKLFELARCQSDDQTETHINVEVPINLLGKNHEIQTILVRCILRSMYTTEINTLETICGCKSKDWTKIRFLQQQSGDDYIKDLSEHLPQLLSDTTFHDTVVLIYVANTEDIERKYDCMDSAKSNTELDVLIPNGIHRCTTISNSMIHINSSKVHNCNVISHTYIGSYSNVMNCTYMSMSTAEEIWTAISHKNNTIVENLSISVGAESGGGRKLTLLPESTMIDVCQQIVHSSTLKSEISSDRIHASFNMIGSYCIVRDTPTLCRLYLHPKASIIAATHVQNVLLFPNSSIRNACTVTNSVLQWNCSITDHSYVLNVFLMEQAMVGPQSTVTNTVLGPDVHISCGEVHASILGPNTNAHHQSLVIASLWMYGRGNVGYGANVGSNHTGRIPDQECCVGEGIFWGLSCVVKFPVDLSHAPYSIIAAGTTLAPQRCTMPFSLIVNNTEREGTGTDIIPGWVLRYSPYTIVRSEQKFAQRRKAIRHMNYTGWNIIRPDIINLCYIARRQLLIDPNMIGNNCTMYTSNTIPGLGASHLTEKYRLIGIQAYSEVIQQFALQGLCMFVSDAFDNSDTSTILVNVLSQEFLCLDQSRDTDCLEPVECSSSVAWPSSPWEDMDPSQLWSKQRRYLLEEFPLTSSKQLIEWLKDLLGVYVNLATKFNDRVYQCKQRDDNRGIETIPSYEEHHVMVDQDPVVFAVSNDLKQRQQQVDQLLEKLSHLL